MHTLEADTLIIDIALFAVHFMAKEDAGTHQVLQGKRRSIDLFASHYACGCRDKQVGYLARRQDGEAIRMLA